MLNIYLSKPIKFYLFIANVFAAVAVVAIDIAAVDIFAAVKWSVRRNVACLEYL